MAEQTDPEAGAVKAFAWRWQQALIGLAVGVALLALTMRRAPIGDILASLRAIDFGWAAMALLAYAVDLGIRVIRWRILFLKVAPLPVATFARALIVGYGLNILLPARLGELARIEYLKLHAQTRRSAAVPAILIERAMDGVLVLSALIAGLAIAHRSGAGSPGLAGLIGAGALMVALVIAAPLLLARVPAWIELRLPRRVRESLVRASAAVTAMDRGTLVRAALITLPVYLAEAAAIAAILRGLGVTPAPGLLLAVLGAASLSTLLPTAPGFIGSYQLAYALVFELFGQNPVLGAAAATAVQVVLFTPVVVLALILALAPQRKKRRSEVPARPEGRR
jgi:uncharacterized membrane protein YbhN (UPF0104 family)